MDSSIHSDGRRWVAVPRCTWPAVGRRKPAQTRRAASGGTWHAEKFGVAWIRRSTPMGVGGWQSLAARGPPLVDANRPRQGARRVAGHGTPSHGRRRSIASIDRSIDECLCCSQRNSKRSHHLISPASLPTEEKERSGQRVGPPRFLSNAPRSGTAPHLISFLIHSIPSIA